MPGTWFLVNGAEDGIVTQGAASVADTIWSSTSGSPAIETSIVRSGAKSYKFAASATPAGLTPPVPASQSVLYFRHYFYFDSISLASNVTLVLGTVAVANNFVLVLKTTNVIEASFGSGVAASSSAAIAANEWIGVECQVDLSANPNRIKWRMWRSSTGWVDQTGGTRATAADTFTAYKFGQVSGGPTSAWNMYADDCLGFLGTTPDEEYAATSKGGKVLRYLPTSDGTHSAFTTGDFKDTGGSNLANSATTIYQLVDDDDQSGTSDFVQQAVAGAGKYVRFNLADEATETVPRVVAVVSTHHSSGAGANEMHLRVSDDGTNWTNLWGDWSAAGKDIGGTSARYLVKYLTTKPSGGSWSQAAVNGLTVEWGNSDDIAPVPYIDSVSAQVEWTEVSNINRTVSDALGAADSLARATTNSRAISDSRSQSESVARVLALPRAASDALARADAATRSAGAARSGTDALAASEAIGRAVAGTRAMADGLSRADLATRQVGMGRGTAEDIVLTATDALTMADAASRVLGVNRPITDGLALTEALVRSVSQLRSMVDLLIATDAVARSSESQRMAMDGVGASDASGRGVDVLRSSTDGIAAGEAVVRAMMLVRAAVDTLSPAEVVSRSVAGARSAADSVHLADLISALAAGASAYTRSASESVSTADAPVRGLVALRVVNDARALLDAVARTADASRVAGEGLVLAITLERTTVQARDVSDSVSLAQAISRAERPLPDGLTASVGEGMPIATVGEGMPIATLQEVSS